MDGYYYLVTDTFVVDAVNMYNTDKYVVSSQADLSRYELTMFRKLPPKGSFDYYVYHHLFHSGDPTIASWNPDDFKILSYDAYEGHLLFAFKKIHISEVDDMLRIIENYEDL